MLRKYPRIKSDFVWNIYDMSAINQLKICVRRHFIRLETMQLNRATQGVLRANRATRGVLKPMQYTAEYNLKTNCYKYY